MNNNIFFYNSDHLGTTSYLTDDAGYVTQTLNYLPYGEDWVDLQNHFETRYPRLGIYTYNGKEKDYESGFHYFGARYYWSELLTGWLSVDPMMDKYPSISPYAYCNWNPVIFFDPDGQSYDGYESATGDYKWFEDRHESSFVDDNGTSWSRITDNKNDWDEATTIREANIEGLINLGYDRKEVENDVRLYNGDNPLFTKESHLLNPDKYITSWKNSYNSGGKGGITKTSPEIKGTGYSLKFYSEKGGQKNANSLGIVKSSILGHLYEFARERYEEMMYPGTAVSDPSYDMHYDNARGLLHGLSFPKEQLYSPPSVYSNYHKSAGMKLP